VLGGEALLELGMAQHVRPELEEDRQPAVAGLPTPLGPGGHSLECLSRRGRLARRGLHLLHAPVHAALVDGEEEVLFRVEVRVDRAFGEAGLGRHRVDRGGVEALAREQPLRGVDELVAGALLALRACHHR
jgi:hypothetical protein